MTNIIHNNDIANIISQIKKDAKKITKKKNIINWLQWVFG